MAILAIFVFAILSSWVTPKVVTFESNIREFQLAGELACITFESGSIAIVDTNGRVINRFDLELEPEHIARILPEYELLAVIRNVHVNWDSMMGQIEGLFASKSSIELWNYREGNRFFTYKFKGSCGGCDVDLDLGLIALEVGRTRTSYVHVVDLATQELLLDKDVTISYKGATFDDSLLYLIKGKSVEIYRVTDAGRLIRDRTEMFDFRFYDGILVHRYYEDGQRRVAILNEKLDSTLGPITFVANREMAHEVTKWADTSLPSALSFSYRHKDRQLYVSDKGVDLHVLDFESGQSRVYHISDLLEDTGLRAWVSPFSDDLCLTVPIDDKEGKWNTVLIFRLPE